MDSQQTQMKLELESFINKGLEEGQLGWPTRMSAQNNRRDLFFACAEGSGSHSLVNRPSDSSISRNLLLRR